MDSCNPFTLRFWHVGNLFGISRNEKVQVLKEKKLDALFTQIELSHPEQASSQILCPLTNQPIQEPVITVEGIVYEKYALIMRLNAFYDVPGAKQSLTREDIYDFKELIGVLEFSQLRIKYYQAQTQLWITKINQVLLNIKQSLNYPNIFLCPLSNQKIQSAVITSSGRIYEEEAIKGYLESTGNNFDPIDGTPLCANSLVPFHPLNESICFYRNFVAESAVKVAKVVDKALDFMVVGIDFAHSFFEAPTYIEEEGEVIEKPGMSFNLVK